MSHEISAIDPEETDPPAAELRVSFLVLPPERQERLRGELRTLLRKYEGELCIPQGNAAQYRRSGYIHLNNPQQEDFWKPMFAVYTSFEKIRSLFDLMSDPDPTTAPQDELIPQLSYDPEVQLGGSVLAAIRSILPFRKRNNRNDAVDYDAEEEFIRRYIETTLYEMYGDITRCERAISGLYGGLATVLHRNSSLMTYVLPSSTELGTMGRLPPLNDSIALINRIGKNLDKLSEFSHHGLYSEKLYTLLVELSAISKELITISQVVGVEINKQQVFGEVLQTGIQDKQEFDRTNDRLPELFTALDHIDKEIANIIPSVATEDCMHSTYEDLTKLFEIGASKGIPADVLGECSDLILQHMTTYYTYSCMWSVEEPERSHNMLLDSIELLFSLYDSSNRRMCSAILPALRLRLNEYLPVQDVDRALRDAVDRYVLQWGINGGNS